MPLPLEVCLATQKDLDSEEWSGVSPSGYGIRGPNASVGTMMFEEERNQTEMRECPSGSNFGNHRLALASGYGSRLHRPRQDHPGIPREHRPAHDGREYEFSPTAGVEPWYAVDYDGERHMAEATVKGRTESVKGSGISCLAAMPQGGVDVIWGGLR